MDSLPTPPKAAFKDKENIRPPRKCIEWAEDEIHLFSSIVVDNENLKAHTSNASTSAQRKPLKSILKPVRALEPIAPAKTRELTPFPTDLDNDRTYLATPIQTILSSDASPRQLTEAYSVLSARIRAVLPTGILAGLRRVPSLDPLRSNLKAFIKAHVRDLGRILEDPVPFPAAPNTESDTSEDMNFSGLPTPKDSPKKKKGMTEEQAKYARDICHLGHAAIRFTVLVFTTNNLQFMYNDDGMAEVLDQVLAVALAPSLPTPNARKTWGLIIMTLQVMSINPDVLYKARDRIAYAIRRGIDGEMGKDGKRGPLNDGLKAICDLTISESYTFAPAFTKILPSILDQLLSNSPATRLHAANALGGLAFGFTKGKGVEFLADEIKRAGRHIVAFLLESPEPVASQTELPRTPTSSPDWSPIVKSLRVTLRSELPAHTAQGPAWALSVISSFIILLGPKLFKNVKILKLIGALLQLSLRHNKKCIRALACAVWNPLLYAWDRWGALVQTAKDGESEAEKTEREEGIRIYWELAASNMSYRNGASIVRTALGNHPGVHMDYVNIAILTVEKMVGSGGERADGAMNILGRIVMPPEVAEKSIPGLVDRYRYRSREILLPEHLFPVKAGGGMLDTEWKGLSTVATKVVAACPTHEDIRPLGPAEIGDPLVWERLMKIWKDGVAFLALEDDEGTPPVILDSWLGLIKGKIANLNEDEAAISDFCKECAETLVEILKNNAIDLGATSTTLGGVFTKKLAFTRDLYGVVQNVFPIRQLRYAITVMVNHLVLNSGIDPATESAESPALTEWATFCAQIALRSAGHLPKTFFCELGATDVWTAEKRSAAWRAYAKHWRVSDGTWVGACAILSFPFDSTARWNMSDRDLTEWDGLLQHIIATAHRKNWDCSAVLEKVMKNIDHENLVQSNCATQIADLLLSNLDLAAEKEPRFPTEVVNVVHDVLATTYPPDPQTKVASNWLLRSITSLIDHCPGRMLVPLVKALQDVLCIWMTDAMEVYPSEEYIREVVPVYQNIIVSLMGLLPSVEELVSISTIFSPPLYKYAENNEALDVFKEFWETSCASLIEPEGGWPEGLSSALDLLRNRQGSVSQMKSTDQKSKGPGALLDVFDALYEATSNDEVDDLPYPESEEDVLPSPTKRRRSTQAMRPIMFKKFSPVIDPYLLQKSTSAATDTVPNTPTTPRNATTVVTAPARPDKLAALIAALENESNRSPPSPLTSKRPRSRVSSGSRIRMDRDDKENNAPDVVNSPRSSRGPSVKRKTSFEIPQTEAKKQKLSNSPAVNRNVLAPIRAVQVASPVLSEADSDGSDDLNAIDASLFVVEGSPVAADSAITKTTQVPEMTKIPSLATMLIQRSSVPLVEVTGCDVSPSKKRKRVFMEAVVVPTLALVESTSIVTPFRPSRPNAQTSDRRTRSQTKSGFVPFAAPEDTPSRQKRRKTASFSNNPKSFGEQLACSSNEKLRTEVDLPGSDDSISSDGTAPASSSSDDDFSIGKVMPHHLVSPPLRRTARLRPTSPPSDDSNMSDSPTRDHMARKLVRTRSLPTIPSELPPYLPGSRIQS